MQEKPYQKLEVTGPRFKYALNCRHRSPFVCFEDFVDHDELVAAEGPLGQRHLVCLRAEEEPFQELEALAEVHPGVGVRSESQGADPGAAVLGEVPDEVTLDEVVEAAAHKPSTWLAYRHFK